MQIQVSTDNATEGRERRLDEVEATVRDRLSRFADRISRVEIHLSDVNGDRGGDDMRCVIEVRPKGLDPLVATDQADSIEGAVTAAANKAVAVLDRTFGKLTSRKGH